MPLKPVAGDDRYPALDVLRGLSLLGVLLVNDLDFFRVSLFEQLLVFHTHPGWGNRLVDVLVAGLLEFKAFALFSLLFGVGIGIQAERLGAHGLGVSRFLARRLAVLLGFGLVHLFLLSNVDILCLYAICGLLLIPLLRCRAALLACLGVVALALAVASPFGWLFPSAVAMREQATAAANVYSTGTFHALLVFRWHETWHFIVPLLLSVLLRTFGLMLLGVAAWRAGILQRPAEHRRLLIAMMLAAGSLGGVATGLVVFRQTCGRPAIESLPPALLDASASVPLALAYAAAFLLWVGSGKRGTLIASVAALGQMALTNYLGQSVILGFIFYSYGFGMFGQLGSAPAALIGLGIYVAQLGISRVWLKHYRFGPAEWVWRSLTYGEWQPMRQTRRPCVQPIARTPGERATAVASQTPLERERRY